MTEQEKDEPKTYTVCETYKQGYNWVIECRGLMLDGAEICKRVYVSEWVDDSVIDVESEKLLDEIEATVLAVNCFHKGDVQGLVKSVRGEYRPITDELLSITQGLMPDIKQAMEDGSVYPKTLRRYVRNKLSDLERHDSETSFMLTMTPEEKRFHDSDRECHYKP